MTQPLIATVRVKPSKDGYDASNEIRGYEPVGAVAAVKNPVAPPTMPKPATKTPPWRQAKA